MPIKKFISDFVSRLKTPKSTKRFMQHNSVTFKHKKEIEKKEPIVLLEHNTLRSAHIAYSYLGNALAKKYNAKIIAYNSYQPKNLKQKLSLKTKELLKFDHWGVYQSFGTDSFLNITPSRIQKNKSKHISKKLLKTIFSTKKIEGITINGSWIGDLIYDTYLRSNNLPTIDWESESFIQHLQESIEIFVAWEEFFDNHNVCAINVSHCVYNTAIPLRIALNKGIEVYQINLSHAYKLKSKNMFAYNDFHYFPEMFSRLSKSIQEAGKKEAKKRIEKRFSGVIGVDMNYSKKSAYGDISEKRLLMESPRKKILIATHCFFDSPHSYGNNLFPDFYEWLTFLGEVSKKTNYDWYIKTHPDYLPGTMDIINNFIDKYPKFNLLPAEASHHQIIKEGINCVLSVYGTIGFEYAALGIPVINASINNPHIAYNFNLHPKTIAEYQKLLLGLDDLTFTINKQEVYEYYFMRFIFNTQNIFFNDYDKLLIDIGGYSNQFKPEIYDVWQQEFTQEKHQMICKALENFINSSDFRMDYSHFGKEFSMKNIEATS